MTEPSHAVFLSYASQDAQAAQRICAALRAAGIEVWFDQSELRGGEAWDRQIRDQIHECRLFIPVISANTEARDEGYFRREWGLAVERMRDMAEKKAFLLPVVIDETLERSASVPDKFRSIQWTRLPAGCASQAFVARVAGLLGHTTPADTRQGTPHESATNVARQGTPRGAMNWRWAAIAVAVIVAVMGWTTWRHSGTAIPLPAGRGDQNQTLIGDKSIAVLPFEDLSEKHDQEYFGDGVAEEILDLLAKVPELKVIGRTSSFQFKGKNEDLRSIGRQLGVRYLLEGSVRQSGNTVRLTAQVIDAREGAHVWSETYDRPYTDLLKVQGDVAAAIAHMLELSIGLDPLTNVQQITSADAYNGYLRALSMLNRYDEVGLAQAEAGLREALKHDPSFLRAREELAFAHFVQAAWGFTDAKSGFALARKDAETLLSEDPQSAFANGILGSVALFQFDWTEAERRLSAARAAAPNSILALFSSGDLAAAFGRWDESASYYRRILTLDPLHSNTWNELGVQLYRAGRLDDSEAAIRRCLTITPTFAGAHADLAYVMFARGKIDEALAEMEQDADASFHLMGRAMVYYARHRRADADAALASLIGDTADRHAYRIALVLAYRGDRDAAFRWLDRAYAQTDAELQYIKGEPLLRHLEADPRYSAFLRRMNLPG